MMDSLVSRQGPEGGFPMGYGEEKRIFWVADNGTAAMAVVDFAHRFPDLRESYLAAVRRYYDWRETFYMDDERIAKAVNIPRDPRPMIIIVHPPVQPGFTSVAVTSERIRRSGSGGP